MQHQILEGAHVGHAIVTTAVVLEVDTLLQCPGSLLKMQISTSHRRPPETEILGWCPAMQVNLMLTQG